MPEPTLLHESIGLKIVKNPLNRFVICTLHYTADPAKRTEAWKAEAQAGVTPAEFAKEYEIDYCALYGARVFPEIALNKAKIVVQEPHREFGPDQVFWGGFDFGSRNPSSFHVYTYDDGVFQAIWELYEPCKNVPEFCAKMLACPYYPNIKYIAADPTIINQKSRTNRYGTLVTMADLMYEQGVGKLIAGNTDETTWLATMRKHWANPDDPTFQIWSCCPEMIKELENAVFASQSSKEILTQTYKEEIADVHNHACDDLKYTMNSRPGKQQYRKHVDPKMHLKWQH